MYNPLLMIDFYKATHAEQYPEGMTMIYSPGTPRMSRLADVNKVVYFGGQAFCKEYLIKAFNENFFSRSEEEIVAEYDRVLTNTLGPGTYNSEKVRKLHRLGYLPIAMYAVPEGMSTAIGVPQSVFVNTHPDFAWLTNTLETAFSAYIWHIQISAEVGKRYRKIVEKYYKATCDENIRISSLLGDFSMRGQHSPESAMKSSAAWLLSFRNTATVPAIMWLEDNYNADCENEEVGYGAISTEHSVMCSNFSIDGDEITQVRRLLTEIYPTKSFSMVSDSYDYWNLVDNILPQLKDEILNHTGCLSIRGDSGDPVEVIAGKEILYFKDYNEMMNWSKFAAHSPQERWESGPHSYAITKDDNQLYEIRVMTSTFLSFTPIEKTAEIMGTVWALWQNFGGTVNSKGYKVLNPHVKTIYGDSITPQRCEEIYKRLITQGFAINNVILGVGSFSFMCLEENGRFNPYTRDTFSYAIKATYGEDKDGLPIMIQKQPKALAWKKSQRGCIWVNPNGKDYIDNLTFNVAHAGKKGETNLLQLVFKDGKMVKEHTLAEIRERMWGEF